MKIVIDKESIINVFTITFYATLGGDYNAVKDVVKELLEKIDYEPYEERPQGELANEVWQLYEKHHSHLATHVIEFGDELKELLDKYQNKELDDTDCMEEDAKQASIPYTYNAPQHDWKCGYSVSYLHKDSITKSDTHL